MARLRRPLTFSNVVSMLALFVALGGTSVAAISLARNSVKTKHIAPNAVTSAKVKNQTLLAADFRPGQLPQGEKGDKGDPGATGAPGTAGAPGSPAASWVAGNSDAAMLAGSGTSAFSPMGASQPAGSFESRTQLSPNATIVVRDLVVAQVNAAGATAELRYKLVVDPRGAKTILLQCTIQGATAKTCDSGSQAATVAPASELSMEVSRIGSTASTHAHWGFRALTP